MSREEDSGIEIEQNLLDTQIKIRMQIAKEKPLDISNSSGECWFCEEPTGHDRRWCDAECCRSWELEND